MSTLVRVDELGDAQQLRIRCLLNGDVVQDSTTAEMVFPVAELIAVADQALELEERDLLATGTPASASRGSATSKPATRSRSRSRASAR